ncbi:hypothetical protein ACLKOZ_17035 [Arthrobacter sp. R4]|uniref:hypothetical protein n=1 Tax=Arthrobacter sp. R4 TaxID=644417 RepID=UPI003EDB342C
MPKSKTESSTPRLSEFAKSFVFPSTIQKTVWPRVEAKGRELGLGFDWWQSQLGTVCLGYDDRGKYVATVGGVGLSIPRQVGKTYFVLAMLVILCVLFPGLQVVWTAHHLRTSTKTFTTLRGICRRKKISPLIRAMRAGNGEQQVEFTNGSMIMFGARSQGFGRGFDEIDVEVFDEAQILDTKALEDMIAATNQARNEHGALLFFMGTPPRPSDPSEAFELRRSKALEGKAPNAIWLEIAAERGSDPDDRSQWPIMNPSFPHRTPVESMERLRENLGDDDSWNREGRGIWDASDSSRVIDEESWARVADPASMAIDRLTIAVDVAPDRTVAAVGLAGLRADGTWHVELDDHRRGTDWVAHWVKDRASKNRLHSVVVDELSGLVEERRGRHFLIGTDIEVTLAASEGRDMAIASAKFYDSVMGASLRHTDQPQVNVALSVARKRPLGAGWAWNRKDAVSDITPVVALTLALWGAQNDNVKRPSRRTGSRTAVVL